MTKTSIIILAIVLILVVGIIYVVVKPDAKPAQPAQQQNSSATNIQGMKIETLQQGTGDGAKTGDLVTVNYTGTLLDGTKFDSNVDPSFGHVQPFQFTLGQNKVINGWELGVLGMKVGEKRKLIIPPELAYGSQSPSPLIPANSTLIFEIDLLKIN